MGKGLEEIGISDDADDDATQAPPAAAAPTEGPEAPPASSEEAPRARAGAPVLVLSRPVSGPTATTTPEPRLVETLARVPLFAGMPAAQIARLARIARERVFGPGEAIFRHGDRSEGLFVVLEGAVKITRSIGEVGEETLAVLRTGQHFGEMSLIDDNVPRSADATAHQRVRALMLPRDDLRDLMFVDRDLAYDLLWRFVRLLTRRVRESNDRLAMLSSSARF